MANLFQAAKRIFESRRYEANMTDRPKEIISDKKIYFLDTTALVHFSGKLYGCFLVEQFEPKYLISGENNVFVTDERTLQEIMSMEIERKNGIYVGFTEFIKRNFKVISDEDCNRIIKAENHICREFGMEFFAPENDPFAHIIGSLFYLYDSGIEPVLVTCDAKTEEMARKREFEIYKII